MSEWIECPNCKVLYKGEHTCSKQVATATKTQMPAKEDRIFGPHFPKMWTEASAKLLDNLAAFELEVDMDTWVDLYLKAVKALGKVLGRSTAEHLWTKFRDMGIIRMWGLLDTDNREIVATMLTMWKR